MRRDVATLGTIAVIGIQFQLPLVFVVMAVKAQQFPVAAIGRVVVVIMVSVMDGQLTQIGVREFAAAATADPWINLQRLLSISQFVLCSGTACLGDNAV